MLICCNPVTNERRFLVAVGKLWYQKVGCNIKNKYPFYGKCLGAES